MAAGLINPGDKIDITFLHHNNGKIYKSSVFDILGENELEIGMPTEEGRMVLFQIGFACQFYFYTSKGMYSCEAVVTNRYKKDNFYLLSVKVTSGLKKYQRRDFYRVETAVNFAYYHITAEIAKLETTEDLFEEIADPKYIEEKKAAITKDISGGGVRFSADEKIEIGEKILSVIRLSNEKVDQTFYLVSEIISCEPMEKVQGKWVIRAKWIFKDIKDRDTIVRFVFEEDRIIRKKESGE